METTTQKAENNKVERAPSKSNAVKGLATTAKNLKKAGLINDEDYKKLQELHKKVMKQWVGEDLF